MPLQGVANHASASLQLEETFDSFCFLSTLLVRDCLLETVLRFWQSSSLLQQEIFCDLLRNHQSLLYLDDIIVCRWAKSGIQDRIHSCKAVYQSLVMAA